MTHLQVTIQPAEGGTSSDGAPGERPLAGTVTVTRSQVQMITNVVVGEGGRGADAGADADGVGGSRTSFGGSSGAVVSSTVVALGGAQTPRMPDGADGHVRVAVYDCGCTVELAGGVERGLLGSVTPSRAHAVGSPC